MGSGPGKASWQAEVPGPSATGHAAFPVQPQAMMNEDIDPTRTSNKN